MQFQRPLWEVLTGRRDGTISRMSEALANIPSPFFNFTTLKQSFANKSLSTHDLVVLSGKYAIRGKKSISFIILTCDNVVSLILYSQSFHNINCLQFDFAKIKCRCKTLILQKW